LKKIKIKKPKINTKDKSYELKDSCLYKLGSVKKLARLLNLPLEKIEPLKSDDNYNVFINNGRTIEQPTGLLDIVQTRIASLLVRIKPSNSLHSGVKKRSHITNARVHLGQHPLLTSDIRGFFKSTSTNQIFLFFRKQLKCSADVSDTLTAICSYSGHIPTGSRISMVLAYWANRPMFDEWEAIAKSRNLNFSIFVDDITFSGHGLNRKFVSLIKRVATRHNHQLHPDKTKLYRANSRKNVTGTSIDGDNLIVSQKNHKNIYADMILWMESDKCIPHKNLENRILGKLTAQAQVDPRYKDKARSFRLSIKNFPTHHLCIQKHSA